MKDTELVERVLFAAFPEECNAAGRSNVKDIISGDVVLAAPDEGRPFPIGEVLPFLKDAAQLTLAFIAIYKALKDQLKRKPTVAELESKVATSQSPQTGVSKQQAKSIIDQIRRID